ncbi:predicted protein [Scheffersomyces stipitis CBS 6054]|uniref:Uncharacterized protein n=1 Tax=Scheffersomyces stipitis (strain ATCC 58785 / CBS 6054 / NBRC 10063 / NRRL Y-11545) TaxID=322104 RepID=A3LRK9_PICST|nr:predicted protein [Scheffersomyces stipitis CBS 6054]ABN65757.2 predicted protein [Scheffersomyces stipitis CBS 6054]
MANSLFLQFLSFKSLNTKSDLQNITIMSSNDDNESIDPRLRDLVLGTESLTYGDDVFHDAPEPAIENHESPQLNNEEERVQNEEPNPVPPANLVQMPLNTIGADGKPVYITPGRVTLLKDDSGNSYLLHPNGFVSPVNAPKRKSERNKRKRKVPPFFHMPTPITKNTTAEELLRCHTNVLELVQFSEIMNKETSSRYGDLDTSSTVLHSATNSSKSSTRSSTRNQLSNNNSVKSDQKKPRSAQQPPPGPGSGSVPGFQS